MTDIVVHVNTAAVGDGSGSSEANGYTTLASAVAASTGSKPTNLGDTLEFRCVGTTDTSTTPIDIDINYAGAGIIIFQGDHIQGPKFDNTKYHHQNSTDQQPITFNNCADVQFKGFQHLANRSSDGANLFASSIVDTSSTLPNVTATDCYFSTSIVGGTTAFEVFSLYSVSSVNNSTNTPVWNFDNCVFDGDYQDLYDMRDTVSFNTQFDNCTFASGTRMLAYSSDGGIASSDVVFNDCIFDEPVGHSSLNKGTLNNCAYRSGAFSSSTNGIVDNNPIALGATAYSTFFANSAGSDYTAVDALPLSGAGVSGGLVGSSLPIIDSTAPILSSATAVSASNSSVTAGATTDEANGIIYAKEDASATPLSAAAIKLGQNTTVSSTGAQVVTVTSLSSATAYYIHMIHTDDAGNDSNIIVSTQVTTDAVDTQEPTLTSPDGNASSNVAITARVVTDESGGTLYARESSTATPLADSFIKGGSWNKAVTEIGLQTLTISALAPASTHYINFLHTDAAGNDSAIVVSSAISTTGSAPDFVGTPLASSETTTSVEISFDVDRAGFFRLICLDNAETAPSEQNILDGVDSTGALPIYASEVQAVSDLSPVSEVVTGLTAGQSYDIYIVLYNGTSTFSAINKVDVSTLTTGNEPPTITSTAITTATSGLLYQYVVSTTDPEGDAKTLTVTTKPGWLSLSGSTLSGTPTDGDIGNNAVTLRVADSKGSTTQDFIINVLIPPDQSPYNNGEISTVDSSSAVAANTPLAIKKLDGTVVKGVVVGDFEESSIPITYASSEAPRYQHAWNSYTDKGTTFGEETYEFVADDDALFGDQVFRVNCFEDRPYPQINTNVSSTSSVYVREAIKSGTWEFNTYNRLRVWIKFPKIFVNTISGDTNMHFGTYVRGIDGDTSDSESGGGGHYYHYMNIVPTEQWHQVIIDWHPQHQRQNDPSEEWDDIQYPIKTDASSSYNYFDLMTRFYFQFKPEGYQFDTYPIMVDLAGVEIYEEQRPESVLHIASLNGVYDNSESNNMLHIGWSRIKADDTTTFDVRYAFDDIWLSGWDAATPAPDGTANAPKGSGTYARCSYDNGTIAMGSNSKIYVAVKRTGDANSEMRQIIIPLTAAGYPPLGGNQ